MSTNSEKIEDPSTIFWDIWWQMPIFTNFLHRYTSEPRDFRGYWTKAYQISTRYIWIIATVIAPIGITIFQSISERQGAERRLVANFSLTLVFVASAIRKKGERQWQRHTDRQTDTPDRLLYPCMVTSRTLEEWRWKLLHWTVSVEWQRAGWPTALSATHSYRPVSRRDTLSTRMCSPSPTITDTRYHSTLGRGLPVTWHSSVTSSPSAAVTSAHDCSARISVGTGQRRQTFAASTSRVEAL